MENSLARKELGSFFILMYEEKLPRSTDNNRDGISDNKAWKVDLKKMLLTEIIRALKNLEEGIVNRILLIP